MPKQQQQAPNAATKAMRDSAADTPKQCTKQSSISITRHGHLSKLLTAMHDGDGGWQAAAMYMPLASGADKHDCNTWRAGAHAVLGRTCGKVKRIAPTLTIRKLGTGD